MVHVPADELDTRFRLASHVLELHVEGAVQRVDVVLPVLFSFYVLENGAVLCPANFALSGLVLEPLVDVLFPVRHFRCCLTVRLADGLRIIFFFAALLFVIFDGLESRFQHQPSAFVRRELPCDFPHAYVLVLVYYPNAA